MFGQHQRFYFEVETQDNAIIRPVIRAMDWDEAEKKLNGGYKIKNIRMKDTKPLPNEAVRKYYGSSSVAFQGVSKRSTKWKSIVG